MNENEVLEGICTAWICAVHRWVVLECTLVSGKVSGLAMGKPKKSMSINQRVEE